MNEFFRILLPERSCQNGRRPLSSCNSLACFHDHGHVFQETSDLKLETTPPRRPRGGQSGREKRRGKRFQAQAEKPLGTDTQGLFRPCLKTFVAPFNPARLTAPGSSTMETTRPERVCMPLGGIWLSDLPVPCICNWVYTQTEPRTIHERQIKSLRF